MKSSKRIAVIGLGSMGKRRVRDLSKLGFGVTGFDVRLDRRLEAAKQFGIDVVSSESELFTKNLDAVVISTPTDTHYYFYSKCFKNKISFFSEANIFTPKHKWFTEQEKINNIKSYPSASWKFHPCFNTIKGLLKEKKINVNSIHYHYSGYLPFWHPYEEYDKYYAGIRKTSAAREMVPFELEALVYLIGNIKAVTSIKGGAKNWLTNFDDYYYLLLEFENGKVGTLMIELFNVAPYRQMVIACDNSSIEFNGALHQVKEFNLHSNSYKIHLPTSQKTLGSFDFEEIYLNEMKCFCEALFEGKKYCKTWEEERHLSDVLFAAELSNKTKHRVEIKTVINKYMGKFWK